MIQPFIFCKRIYSRFKNKNTKLSNFTLVGGKDKKLVLENATHPCPGCKRTNTVQLTRIEKRLVIMNRRIELPNSMRVRYECRKCQWKNETLPDDDPLYQSIPNEENERLSPYLRKDSISQSSIVSTSSISEGSSLYLSVSINESTNYYKRSNKHFYNY